MAEYRGLKLKREELKKMYWDKCLSVRDIAENFNVTAGTITYWMKKLKVSFRTQEEACNTKKCRKKNSESIMQEKHPLWKGKIKKMGYTMIRLPGKYVLEHRFLVEKEIGRKLEKFEVVHHINNIRDDNRMENLYIFYKREHDKFTSSKNKKILKSNIKKIKHETFVCS